MFKEEQLVVNGSSALTVLYDPLALNPLGSGAWDEVPIFDDPLY